MTHASATRTLATLVCARAAAFTAAALVVVALAPLPAAAQATFGAIAWDSETGRWGYSFNYQQRPAAEQRALDECGNPDCEVRTWFRNACGALAVSGNGHGAGWGETETDAQAKAMELCRAEGNSACQLATSTCSAQ